MLSKKRTKVLIALSFLAILTGVAGACMEDMVMPMPVAIADTLRVLVMAQAGYAVAQMLLMMKRAMCVRIDKTDELTEPGLALVMATIVLATFVILSLSVLLRQPYLTIWTPMAAFGLIVADYASLKLGRRLGNMLRAARGGTVKLTMTLTSEPGPDLDLSPHA